MTKVVVPFDLLCADLTGLAVGALRVASRSVKCGVESCRKFPAAIYELIHERPVIDYETIEKCASYLVGELYPSEPEGSFAGVGQVCCGHGTAADVTAEAILSMAIDLMEELMQTCKPYPRALEWILQTTREGNEIYAVCGDPERTRFILRIWLDSIKGCQMFLKPESQPSPDDISRLEKAISNLQVVTLTEVAKLNDADEDSTENTNITILITRASHVSTFPHVHHSRSLFHTVSNLSVPSFDKGPSIIMPTQCASPAHLTVAAWGKWLEMRVDGVQGKVIHGFKRGSTELGMPTANLNVDLSFGGANGSVSLPVPGVFTGWCALKTPEGSDRIFGCVLNVGYCPFYDNEKPSMEVHIYHAFAEDFYGAEMRVDVTGMIRSEGRYADFGDLVGAIQADCEMSAFLWTPLSADELVKGGSKRFPSLRYGPPSDSLARWAVSSS